MTISSEQQRYYERELAYVRTSLAQFALQHPSAAENLGIKGEDPDISRLIDGMALLMANTQQRLDQQMPQMSAALLHLLYPAMLEITPSFACLALTFPGNIEGGNKKEANNKGETLEDETEKLDIAIEIPAGTEFNFSSAHDEIVQLLSTTAITFNPYTLANVAIEIAPFYKDPPAAAYHAGAMITVELSMSEDFNGSEFGHFDFFIQGEERDAQHIIELLLTQCMGLTLTSDKQSNRQSDRQGNRQSDNDSHKNTATITANHAPNHVLNHAPTNTTEYFIQSDRLQSKLNDANFQVLPFGKGQFSGLDMLRDFLAFPDKGRFFTVKGLGTEMGKLTGTDLVLNIYLKQVPSHLLHLFKSNLLALNVIPVLNRFKTSAEPINYDFSQLEVPVVAETDVNSMHQIISIDQVTEITYQGEQKITPLFREKFTDIRKTPERKHQPLHDGLRWQSEQKTDAIGQWKTFLSLTLSAHGIEQTKLLLADLWCCQGNLPCTLKAGSSALSQHTVDIVGQLRGGSQKRSVDKRKQ